VIKMTQYTINKTDFENILMQTERRWLKTLCNDIKSEFSKHPLPSHDHTHHSRVWFFAKELLRALSDAGYDIDSPIVEKVIVSVFFHDAGMTKTLEPSHGLESRLICERYLKKTGGLKLSHPDEILEAIEMHDDKKYAQEMQGINASTILAMADDLDAYGAIGVYRYYEIYLLRGMRKEEIPLKVIDNVEKRFGFMERILGSLHDLIKKHESRKQLTINYFRQFIREDSTIDTALMTPDMEFLDRLVNMAHNYQNGLDFLLDKNTDLSGVNKDLHALINALKKELRSYLFDC